MNKKIPLRFFIITFSWSWIFWIPLGLIKSDFVKSISMPLAMLGAFGPGVGAFLSIRSLEGRGEVKKFLKKYLDLKFGLKTWLVIFLYTGLIPLVSWLIPELFGFERLDMLLPSVFIFPVYWLAMVFLGGGQEELGWRGYIMPKLEERFGIFRGSGLLGIVWALWHLPLWFIPGTSQTFMSFPGFIMLCLGYSYFFSWIIRRSGNRPMAGLIVHGSANAFIPLFPVLVMTEGASQPRFWIWVSINLIAGLLFLGLMKSKEVKSNL